MLDDFDITHRRGDLPPEVWAFLKSRGFFAMIIGKQYGGLGFSAYAHSCVLVKLASRSVTCASTVAVPNSLGPAELLNHYGTEEQKNHYLPRLARGDDIPCFALTGSACRLRCRRTARHRRRLPRPVAGPGSAGPATQFLQALHHARAGGHRHRPGVSHARSRAAARRRHRSGHHLRADRRAIRRASRSASAICPLNIPFQNGPMRGRDVFVPLDSIIGGVKMAGQGWRMLVEQLSVGRCISLPSNATGGAKAAIFATGAYARIRRQFNMPVGKFEGVEQAIARMVGLTYIMDAARSVTIAAIDSGARPAVPAGDPQVPRHRNGPARRERCHGRARRQGHHARAAQLPWPRLPVDSDRDHRRGREHPDPQPDHLRAGRDPLPSVRAARDERGAQSRSRARRRRVRSRAVRPHRLHDLQRGALARDGADAGAIPQTCPTPDRRGATTSTSSASAPRSPSPPTSRC